MEDLAFCLGSWQRQVDAQRSCVSDTVLAYKRPICVGLVDEERKREVSRPELGFGRGYSCAHEAACRVYENPAGCFAVGGVGYGRALEETENLSGNVARNSVNIALTY
jgi:hypothetical protein